MTISGTWDIIMKTPMGDRDARLTLKQDGDALSGELAGDGKQTAIDNGRVENERLLWDVSVTSPMPITLSFDCAMEGENLTGTVKLGMFGDAPVTGTPV